MHSVTLSVHPGSLVAVVGPVGCGKSTLLAGLLGEATLLQSEASDAALVSLSSNVAYCPQLPWIRSANVRDNILLGKPFRQSW